MPIKKSNITKEEFDALKIEAINCIVKSHEFISYRLGNGNKIIHFVKTDNYYLMEVKHNA